MGLKITNRATAKQIALLEKLEYHGQGKYAAANLTVEEAAKIIDDLFEEQKYTYGEIQGIAADYYDFPEDYSKAQYESDNQDNQWK